MDRDTMQFESDLKELGISLSEEQISQFLTYYQLLDQWSSKINLTAIREYSDVLKKHFVDSVSLVRAYDLSGKKSVIDVGTGAGFPGLALKIAFPDLEMTLLDSINKRIHFLDTVIGDLKLIGIQTIHGRAEDLARSDTYREKFDLCVSRAVANLSTLSEYCLPFVKIGGVFVAYKSEKASEEIQWAGQAVSALGGRIKKQVELTLPNSNIYRNLFVVEKIERTPDAYPRKAGVPEKKPL